MDDDADTVVASENRSANDREMKEICLKWVFPMTSDKKKILHGHCAILAMMMKAHPELVIIDNKAREHVDKKTMKATERSRPFEFYADLRNKNNKTMVCIHRVRTQKPLTELKGSWGVIDELQKHRAYVRMHAFNEKEREISHLGFLPGINMANTGRDIVKEEIMSMLKKDNQEIPKFEIVQVGVDMGKGSKLAERTRAYEIQCVHSDASRLSKMLQSGHFQTHPVYVPYRLKKADPKTFKGAIKRQIQVLADQWVIKLQGFNTEMIQHVRDKILESPVEAIVPVPKTTKGEWKLLINRHQYKRAMQWIRNHWEEIMQQIPQDMIAASSFDEQKIKTKDSTRYEPDSEEGTVDTYGTILSSLYEGSNDIDNDNEEDSAASESESPTEEGLRNHPVTYAQVMKGQTSSVSQVSGWTDPKHDDFIQLQEKNNKLEDQLNKVTAELGELKNLLQQLIVQTKQPEEQGPPTKKQATFATPKQSEKRSQRLHSVNNESEGEPPDNGSDPGKVQDMEE